MRYETYHGIIDQKHFETLVESMISNGWQGGPLVADGSQLLTGSHRYPAALRAEIEPQIVDIRDIYPEWDELMAEFDHPTVYDGMYTGAIRALPSDLCEQYGIDIG